MKAERITINNKGESVCTKCENTITYSEKFDAYYCEKCNLWLEERCVDPLCKLCKQRPIRPINKSKVTKKKVRKTKWF